MRRSMKKIRDPSFPIVSHSYPLLNSSNAKQINLINADEIGIRYQAAARAVWYTYIFVPVRFLRAERDGVAAVLVLSAGPQSGPAGLVVGVDVRVRAFAL